MAPTSGQLDDLPNLGPTSQPTEPIDPNDSQITPTDESTSSSTSTAPASPSAETQSSTDTESTPAPTPLTIKSDHLPPEPDSELPELLGHGHRRKIPSVTLQGYVTNPVCQQQKDTDTTASTSTSLYPISNYVSCDRFSISHKAFQTAISLEIEPTSYKQAIKREVWKKAIGSELEAHELNHTWDITTPPPGKIAIGSKWVYKVKFRSDRTIERYKVRLVALGNRQIEGEDYGDTFAPVAKMGTVLLFLQLASGRGWQVHQMDVHNAFLHGDLDEEVYRKCHKVCEEMIQLKFVGLENHFMV